MKNTTLPSKRALAVLDEPPLTDGTAHKRVSKKVTAAIDKMVSGECRTIADAAEQVGLARESLSRALSRPHVAELMRTKVLRSLAIAATRAGATKVELLDSANEMVRDRASSFVLGLAGIKPSKLPIKRPRAPWKIVAQWHKRVAGFAAIAARQAFLGGRHMMAHELLHQAALILAAGSCL